MKLVTIILIFTGLLLGPGYLLYTNYLSGKSVATHSVFEQDVSHVGSGRVSVTATEGGKWSGPVRLDLSPEMNPIRFNFKAKHVGTATRQRVNQYTATLKNDGEIVWKEGFKLTTKKKDKDTVSFGTSSTTGGEIHTFDIESEGPYELLIASTGKSQITVANLSVVIKQNVAIPNRNVAGTGFVIFVVGIIFVFVGAKRS